MAIAASTFKAPFSPKLIHEIQMRHRPANPNNRKHWKLFKDDQEIKRFIETVEEFSASFIDQYKDIGEHNVG